MQKIKRTNFVLVTITILSMVLMYGFVPLVKAATLDSAKDTISDSDVGATGVTHTILFNTGTDLTAGTVITATFNVLFDLSNATGTCPSDSTMATTSNTVTCTVVTGMSSTTDYTMYGINIDNPGVASYYDVTISHDETGAEESTKMMVYIIDDVTVTARVDANLTFSIGGLATTTSVNGDNTTGTSATTTIDFGTLVQDTQYRYGQILKVTTNSYGFTVTVEQDGELESAAGANINSFRDSPTDTGTSTPEAWQAPAELLGQTNTYGHMGVTSEDENLNWGGGNPFGASLYAGFSGATPIEVMYHDGPADGSTDHAGQTKVGYQIQVSSLQEAGDYSNTLTYICTPTF